MRRFLLLLGILLAPSVALAQGYTTPPILQAFQATGLSMPYTVGLVTVGGTQQQINAASLTLSDNANNCTAPQFPACNFVYWAGQGAALSVTTSPQTAFAAGNAIVGFVTTAGGAILNVVYFNQAGNMSDNLLPAGVSTGTTGFRLPLCNTILKANCQAPVNSLSGY